ncbi:MULTISPECIES: tRNA (adenine(22)-N(1))-methyltransferase [Pontibacillus]|uniref:tRNA (Adenine(22)-N(1))-methyltransferase TrmK n=1 Tax=Pontibacillus chungwhensis TaxID=265426 RepID=A0ABY8UX59_9BACI|nr:MULTISPECIES: tRNA (adenine(22)-N(1))-methyltransferase TrmK [Pontibacillus]MCD5323601.1 tRNA (adenine(22)-N(1))-methyltransferase TrmK [Pontibacillus sp. HN14]WIF96969.1 tRNA (adenine(22)-N(1))-methyltransferase TrmK [Pontibacillus chungwhensis]
MKQTELSRRLKAVASFIYSGVTFADIGSDHAYLPAYVCERNPLVRAIAGEVNEGPFQSAKGHIDKQQLNEQVSVRKGNGLAVLEQDEAELVTIAGMGGKLIRTILEEGKEKLGKVERIVAQPNVDAQVVRNWFLHNGYELTEETILEEDGHIYEVLVGDRTSDPEKPYGEEREKDLFFGPFLRQEKTAPFILKWQGEANKLQFVLSQMERAKNPDEDKVREFETQLSWIKEEIASE